MRKNAATAPIIIPAVVNQNAHCSSKNDILEYDRGNTGNCCDINLQEEVLIMMYHMFLKVGFEVHPEYPCELLLNALVR